MRARTSGSSFLASALAAWLLAVSPPAAAGPNAGGTLVVHDTGLEYSQGTTEYPSPPPPCPDVDNIGPASSPEAPLPFVWKVYAAFPLTSAPRLKALAFGAQFDPERVFVLAGGLPDPDLDFEIPLGGWPMEPGGGVGLSLGRVGTAHMVECYWLGGYGSGGAWNLAAHPVQPMIFVDDSMPPQEDPIEALGALGFGEPGMTPCPPWEAPPGACCFADETCLILPGWECGLQGGRYLGAGAPCLPNPCLGPPPPPPLGACCLPDGWCVVLLESECTDGLWLGGGTQCWPDPCGEIEGACCWHDGTCAFWPRSICEVMLGAVWQGPGVPCEPNPCSELPSVCCFPDGSCLLLLASECAGAGGSPRPWEWHCDPDPCPDPGACCAPDGTCEVVLASHCDDYWLGGPCEPYPCLVLVGACCHPDGTCTFTPMVECGQEHFFLGDPCEPNPCGVTVEGCCLPDGICRVLLVVECRELDGQPMGPAGCEPNPCPTTACCLGEECLAMSEEDCAAIGGWFQPVPCHPNPCSVPVPVEKTTWGRIKTRFR